MSVDPARNRFFLLAATRIGGVLLIMFGIVVASGRSDGVPVAAGYAMVVAGFLVIGVLTRRLARRWRSPGDDRP
ncbi:hypothetical protein GGR88_002215 [Sphingomonas jejuensis]|uniref:Uncharacterized protein n=1 Tax=Sphingomonas jejuensis TaxID=904715 RepID=A0ABX0XPT7_9SPHN|nr:hypothetical protein [Sphingomonas jejuensis]NJC34701.1 hypothetical protein [Sphingomonas jejuensis]